MEVIVRDVVCKIEKMNQEDILTIRKKQKIRDAEAKVLVVNLYCRKSNKLINSFNPAPWLGIFDWPQFLAN